MSFFIIQCKELVSEIAQHVSMVDLANDQSKVSAFRCFFCHNYSLFMTCLRIFLDEQLCIYFLAPFWIKSLVYFLCLGRPKDHQVPEERDREGVEDGGHRAGGRGEGQGDHWDTQHGNSEPHQGIVIGRGLAPHTHQLILWSAVFIFGGKFFFLPNSFSKLNVFLCF